MEPERLKSLTERAKEGDKSALEELFTDAWADIYRLALRILKNPVVYGKGEDTGGT